MCPTHMLSSDYQMYTQDELCSVNNPAELEKMQAYLRIAQFVRALKETSERAI